jgi:hypothetical protein
MKNLLSRRLPSLLALVLGFTALAPRLSHAQIVEKFQPVSAGGNQYTFDVSLPVPETVKAVGITANGKAIDPKAVTFAPVANSDYSCDVLFLVDKSSGVGTQGSAVYTRAFQSVLKQLVKKVGALNQKHDQSPAKTPVYHVEIALLEGAAYQELATVKADPAKLDAAIDGVHLTPESQLVGRGLETVISEFQANGGDRKFIVFLSTGELTDKNAALPEIEAAAKQGGVKFCTIGFDTGKFDPGLSQLAELSAETQGLALSTDRVDADGIFALDAGKIDNLLAYMVSGVKGTVDLTGVTLPATFRFDLTTDLGKVYAVEDKVTTQSNSAPVSTPVAVAPATNSAPATKSAPVPKPATNSGTTSHPSSAPAPKPAATFPASAEDWIAANPTEAAVGGLVILVLIVVAIFALRSRPASGPDHSAPLNPVETDSNNLVSDVPSEVEAWLIDGETRHPIDGASVRIGRKPDNDIVIANDSVSNYHAEIIKRDGSYLIVDRGSSNKVFIDGRPVHNVPLKDGDVIELGDVRLHFHLNQA